MSDRRRSVVTLTVT